MLHNILLAMLLIPILANTVYAVTFTDHLGYQPDWARSVGQTQALSVCSSSIDYNSRDFRWCLEFAGYVLDVISQDQKVSFKDHTGYIPKWASTMGKNQALGVCNGSIDYNSKDFSWCMEFAGMIIDEMQGGYTAPLREIEPIPAKPIQTQPKKDSTPKTSPQIPSWIKNTAEWWSDGKISDAEFLNAIKHLIDNKILQIGSSTAPVSSEKSGNVPSWIKDVARWWSEGKMSDSDFVNGIQYLVTNGIIQVSPTNSTDQTSNTNLSKNTIPSTIILKKSPQYVGWIEQIKDPDEDVGLIGAYNIGFLVNNIGVELGVVTFDSASIVASVFDDYKKTHLSTKQLTDIGSNCVEYTDRADNKNTLRTICTADQHLLFLFSKGTDYNKLKENNTKLLSEILANLKNYDARLLYKTPTITTTQGFSGVTCQKDGFGYVNMQGKFTNGDTAYSSIFFKMAVIGFNDEVLATGVGQISDVGAYQTKIFDASARYNGSFKTCEIEIDTAFR